MKTIKQLKVKTASSNYSIYFGNDFIKSFPLKEISNSKEIFFIFDSKMPDLSIRKVKSFIRKSMPSKFDSFKFIANEKNKSIETSQKIIERLIDLKFSRDSLIVSFGGGITTDLAGFVASVYLRGIEVMHIPTTLLAQVDASVGGKTGVNSKKFKNMIGAFKQPAAVLIDTYFLKSLSKRHLAAGYSEIIKHALIEDKNLLSKLDNFDQNIKKKGNITELSNLIRISTKIKANIVEQDEREKSVRAHLNFGHTFAHAIESVQSFKGLNHGEAVGVGMVCAAKLSLLLGKINSQEFDKIKSLIKKFNLPTKLPANCEPAKILKAMQSDKKSKDATLRFIILDGIGKVKIVENVDKEKILNSLKI